MNVQWVTFKVESPCGNQTHIHNCYNIMLCQNKQVHRIDGFCDFCGYFAIYVWSTSMTAHLKKTELLDIGEHPSVPNMTLLQESMEDVDMWMPPNGKPEITLCKWSRPNSGMQSRSVWVVFELRHYYLSAVGSSPTQFTAYKLCNKKPTIIIWQHYSPNTCEMLFCLLACLPTNCRFLISMHSAKTCTTFGL